MQSQRSPLAAPLWLVGLGLVLIGSGIFYLAHILSEKRREEQARQAEAVVKALTTNRPPVTGTQPVLPGWSRATSRPNTSRPAEPAATATEAPAPPVTAVEPSSPATAKKPDFFGLAGDSSKRGFVVDKTHPGIFGVVKLKDTPPPEKPLPLDPACSRLYTTKIPTTRFYVTKDGGLGDVTVFIRSGLSALIHVQDDNPIVNISQKGCNFDPYISGAFVGQRILVRNLDPLILHNVHATPTTVGNHESSVAQFPNGTDSIFVFDKPEMFLRFKCDVHPWMFCYVSTFEHPFFAVTDASGAFAFPEPPPGKYVVEAIHRKAGSRSVEIDFPSQREVNFEFTVPQ